MPEFAAYSGAELCRGRPSGADFWTNGVYRLGLSKCPRSCARMSRSKISFRSELLSGGVAKTSMKRGMSLCHDSVRGSVKRERKGEKEKNPSIGGAEFVLAFPLVLVCRTSTVQLFCFGATSLRLKTHGNNGSRGVPRWSFTTLGNPVWSPLEEMIPGSTVVAGYARDQAKGLVFAKHRTVGAQREEGWLQEAAFRRRKESFGKKMDYFL